MLSKFLVIDQSKTLWEKAQQLIPSATQTFSKGWTQFPFGTSPIFVERGKGAYVWDVDGNRYLDYAMALGPIILGYADPLINEAVKQQIDLGTTFSLPSYLEVAVAEKLIEIIPCAEMVRFGKNGSDATSGAVRAARAYTGRNRVACCGYHGWQDWYIGVTTRSRGVPRSYAELTSPFVYNDIASLEHLFQQYPGEIGCVILEPMGSLPPRDNFLEKVIALSHQEGAVVIFDECWTGFRWALGGAQAYFGVTPDLACFGKAMGNGFPISAVVGRRDIMEIFDDIFFSFTYGGDAIGLAAALAVICELEKGEVLPYIWQLGEELLGGVKKLIETHALNAFIQVNGFPPKQVFSFFDAHGGESLLLKSIVQEQMIQRGILYPGYHVVTYRHTQEDIRRTLDAYDQVFSYVAQGIKKGDLKSLLVGKEVQPVFRKA